MPQEIEPYQETAPVTAQAVIAGVIDVLSAQNVQVPPAWRKIVGAHAKRLLADSFPPDMINAAAYMAVVRGRPELTERIAGDLMLATAGIRMTEAEYEQKVALYAASKKSTVLDRYRETRRTEIERRAS